MIGLLLIFVAGTVLAEAGYKTFLTSFENFINVLLFFFVPWSVINLIDFYIVRKGPRGDLLCRRRVRTRPGRGPSLGRLGQAPAGELAEALTPIARGCAGVVPTQAPSACPPPQR